MKYQEGLHEVKEFLKSNPESKIKDVCEKAGLTEKETSFIVQRFRKGRQRELLSYDMGQCLSSLSIKTTRLLKIIKVILEDLGFIDKHF